MLQGVVARGTARAIGQLSPYVGGKTGTSDDENDAWFVGFTNDVTIGVWVGYDNATASAARSAAARPAAGWRCRSSSRSSRRLGRCTPSRRRSIRRRRRPRRSSWPCRSILPAAAASPTAARGTFTEYFRVRNGEIADTQYNMVSQYEVATPDENYASGGYAADGGERGYPYGGDRSYYGGGGNPFASFFGLFAPQQNYAPQPQRPIYPPAARAAAVPQRLHLSWSAALVITRPVITSAKRTHCA